MLGCFYRSVDPSHVVFLTVYIFYQEHIDLVWMKQYQELPVMVMVCTSIMLHWYFISHLLFDCIDVLCGSDRKPQQALLSSPNPSRIKLL